MKKKDILNLIRCHAEKNERGFRNQAFQIAREFDAHGDGQLAEYIAALLSDADAFVPQMETAETDTANAFWERVPLEGEPLLLPDAIVQDIFGILHAVAHQVGIHTFLFQGPPGTGKTEAAKQLARLMHRELFSVRMTALIDSRLGRSQKNLEELGRELNHLPNPEKRLILFDEVDALALDRMNPRDLREMGRVTSQFLKLLDGIRPDLPVLATTNLYQHLDPAMLRRFDSVIDFNRYTQQDLKQIAEQILQFYLPKFRRSEECRANVPCVQRPCGWGRLLPPAVSVACRDHTTERSDSAATGFHSTGD